MKAIHDYIYKCIFDCTSFTIFDIFHHIHMYLLKCHSRLLNVNSDISEELVIAMATIYPWRSQKWATDHGCTRGRVSVDFDSPLVHSSNKHIRLSLCVSPCFWLLEDMNFVNRKFPRAGFNPPPPSRSTYTPSRSTLVPFLPYDPHWFKRQMIKIWCLWNKKNYKIKNDFNVTQYKAEQLCEHR